jgi:hypothetical protein
VLVALGGALALVLGGESTFGRRVMVRLFGALTREAYDVPHVWPVTVAWRALEAFMTSVRNLSPVFLVVTCLATTAGFVARTLASARVRAGRPDPLVALRSNRRLRVWSAIAPAALLAMPWLFWAVSMLGELRGDRDVAGWIGEQVEGLLSTAGIVGLTFVLARQGIRALLSPLERPSRFRRASDIDFSAIAVTARTRAVVGGFAGATVAMVALTLSAASDPRFVWALWCYLTVALGAPLWLWRASRIAVGVDGVRVRDTSQTRFYPYRDLDDARPRGADLEILARGRAVLRLQLHGDDASRRDEVLARVRAAIARSRKPTDRAAQLVVEAMPPHRIAQASIEPRYRVPSVSRDQLWSLVEGSTSDAPTRTAAAEALSLHLDAAERTRLRLAAARCAEPRLRLALESLATPDAPRGNRAEVDERSESTDADDPNQPMAPSRGHSEKWS